jgi:membrane protease YdiL (CAAX protease family)
LGDHILNDTKSIAIKIGGAVMIGVVILFVSSIIAVIIVNGIPNFSDSMFGIAFFTHTGMLVSSIIIGHFLTKGNLSEYGFKKPSNFNLIRIFSIGLGFGVLVAIVRILISGGVVDMFEDYISIEIILGVWLYASIAEEILTRGLIQGYLNAHSKSGLQISSVFLSIPVLVGAFFFGFMHLATLTLGLDFITVISTVISAIFVGIVAGYYCEKTGSLAPAILIHMLFNIAGSLVGVVFVLV